MIFRRFPLCLAALTFGLTMSHAAMAQVDFDFPDKEVPVLRVDEYYSGPGDNKRPMLLVYSDGRVVRPVSDRETDDYEFTLSEDKFKEILNHIFVVNDFATISDATILNEISSPNRVKRPSSTAFRVTTNTSKGSHVVNYGNSWVHNRLGLGRKRHPDAKHLQRFLNVEEACREVSHLALMGGEEAFQDIVKEAHEWFHDFYPDGPKISETDLRSVRRNQEGEVAVRFQVAKNVVEPYPVSVWVRKALGEDKLTFEVKIDEPIRIHL